MDNNPVLMLCHNALELTKAAVASVLEQDVPVTLFVVDNHSTDGTAEWLETQPVIVNRFKPALGVSAGWNHGLNNIFRRRDPRIQIPGFNADHCLVVNNDVVLRPDTYRELLADGGPFVTGVGVDTIEAIGGEFWKSSRPHPDFSCWLIRREAWEKVGCFDERMHLYASDADYHVQLHLAGISAYTIGLPFYHYASGTLKSAHPAERARIEAQADKDRDAFEQKWGCRIGTPEYCRMFTSAHLDEIDKILRDGDEEH